MQHEIMQVILYLESHRLCIIDVEKQLSSILGN